MREIDSARVPCVNGIQNFSLDQYQNRDNSRAKRKAAAWGAGDFASVLRQNMDAHCDDYATEVPHSIKFRAVNNKALNEPVKRSQGRPRTAQSDVGDRILKLFERDGTNAMKTADAINMSRNTFTRAMQHSPKVTRNVYERIANYFNVSVEWLLTGKEQENEGQQEGL